MSQATQGANVPVPIEEIGMILALCAGVDSLEPKNLHEKLLQTFADSVRKSILSLSAESKRETQWKAAKNVFERLADCLMAEEGLRRIKEAVTGAEKTVTEINRQDSENSARPEKRWEAVVAVLKEATEVKGLEEAYETRARKRKADEMEKDRWY